MSVLRGPTSLHRIRDDCKMPALRYAAGLQSSEVTKVVAVLSPALGQEVTCLPFAAQALAGISYIGCRESRWVRRDASACREPGGWRGLDGSTSDIRAVDSADLDDHTIGSGHDYISMLQAVCGFGSKQVWSFGLMRLGGARARYTLSTVLQLFERKRSYLFAQGTANSSYLPAESSV